MRTRDLIASAVGGLWRQKARSALTLLGVAVGATALAFSLALGVGLRAFIETEFKARREFWSVHVHPQNWGRGSIPEEKIPADKIAVPADLPADRRDRLRRRLIDDYRQQYRPERVTLVTQEQIDRFRRMPDVEEVVASRVQYAHLTLGEKRGHGNVFAGRLAFDPPLDSYLLFGRAPDPAAADEAVLSEFALYKLGLKTDEEMKGAVGRKLRVVLGVGEFAKAGGVANMLAPGAAHEEMSRTQAEILDKIAEQLPRQIDKFDLDPAEKALVKAVMSRPPPPPDAPKRWGEERYSATAEFTVVGVTRLPEVRKFDPTDFLSNSPMPPHEVLIPHAGEVRLFSQVPDFAALGYPEVTVRVTPGGDLARVVEEIEAEGTGLNTFNSLRYYTSVKREVTLISAGLNLFALISLLVAALGIANTLFTSVLERTKEIGVWKSLGARDGHVLALFLLEGSAIGLLGGGLGLLAAWGLSIPSDEWVRNLIRYQRGEGEQFLAKTVFAWPAWVPVAVVAFTALLTTAAALYPARRASRVQPVEALRHE